MTVPAIGRRRVLLGLAALAAGLVRGAAPGQATAPVAERGLRLLDDGAIDAMRTRVARPPAPDSVRVLFVGNSFTYEHDVPGRVAALAAGEGVALDVELLAEGGARLGATLARPGMRALLAEGHWDAIVLQDHSTAALDSAFRAEGATAVAYAAAVAPAPVVLFSPWAREAGHALYTRGLGLRPGVPRPADPAAMTAATAAHVDRLAAGNGTVHVAPVARAWAAAIAGGRRLHGPDRYHAAPAGAALTAEVLWQALAPLLARALPAGPGRREDRGAASPPGD
ncbi:MAG: hypothetical protein AAFV86_06365 [Pseudomonadota bacterium]